MAEQESFDPHFNKHDWGPGRDRVGGSAMGDLTTAGERRFGQLKNPEVARPNQEPQADTAQEIGKSGLVKRIRDLRDFAGKSL